MPFLFLIMPEELSGIIRQANKKLMLERIRIWIIEIRVNMLQLVDVTLFTCKVEPTKNQCILRCFELTLGLRVNFHKSKLGGVGVREEELKRNSIFSFGPMNVHSSI